MSYFLNQLTYLLTKWVNLNKKSVKKRMLFFKSINVFIDEMGKSE